VSPEFSQLFYDPLRGLLKGIFRSPAGQSLQSRARREQSVDQDVAWLPVHPLCGEKAAALDLFADPNHAHSYTRSYATHALLHLQTRTCARLGELWGM
jgi:hypothetical protein